MSFECLPPLLSTFMLYTLLHLLNLYPPAGFSISMCHYLSVLLNPHSLPAPIYVHFWIALHKKKSLLNLNDYNNSLHLHFMRSQRAVKYRNETELSNYTWTLKENKRNYNIKRDFIKQLSPPNKNQKTFRLCLEERLLILKGRKKNILNKRSDMFIA